MPLEPDNGPLPPSQSDDQPVPVEEPLPDHAPQASAVDAPNVEASAAGDDSDASVKMTLGEHLDELRRRLLYAVAGLAVAMGVALFFGKRLIQLAEYPFQLAMQHNPAAAKLAMTGLTDAFMTYLRVSFYAALVASAPWVFYQLWMFVAAGLYPHERRYVNRSIPFSVLLFLAGAAFGVQVSIPAIQFFIGFADNLGVQPIVTLDAYIAFMTNLLLVFGLIFEVPLVVLVLARVGIVNMRVLNKYRRHVIVVMAIAAALLAPPDAMSMILMIVPMWLLYEAGIGLAWLLVFRRKARDVES